MLLLLLFLIRMARSGDTSSSGANVQMLYKGVQDGRVRDMMSRSVLYKNRPGLVLFIVIRV